jgi:hypothetical protein
MDWKKLGKALLFPHIAIMIFLVPIATLLLVGSMVFVGTESPIAIASYVIAAYTLTVWCFKIPTLINFFKTFRSENKYVRKWREDARLRVKVSLYGALVWNGLYGILQLWLGFYHRTFWFYSIGAYYICLGVMRFFLARHTTKYAPGERMRTEIVKYRACGIVFLVMNLALALIIFFMVYFNRTFEHHMITAIAMAAYTFTALTTAIINVIKYRRYNSPVYSASKTISLAAAFVSVLTLEATMLTTFGNGTMTATAQKWMLGVTGGTISLMIVTTAIYMIAVGTKRLKELKTEVNNG